MLKAAKKKYKKKLVVVLTTFIFLTIILEALQYISCIFYLVQFYKDRAKKINEFINFSSEVNAMTPTFIAKLYFFLYKNQVLMCKKSIILSLKHTE